MVRETAYPPGEDEVLTKTEIEDDSLDEDHKRRCTWGKFKEQVEAAGITDEMRIFYIDWDDGHDVQVFISEDKKRCSVT